MEPVSQALKHLKGKEYSEEEQALAIQYFGALRGDLIRTFLRNHELPVSGNKPELLSRIKEALATEVITYEQLVDYLDTVAPLGKQHVVLFSGRNRSVEDWSNLNKASKRLEEGRLGRYMNRKLTLALPKSLSISSIEYEEGKRLVVYAVQRKEAWIRDSESDFTDSSKDTFLRFNAYRREITRGIVLFSWQLIPNSASLHISQLPSEASYDQLRNDFAKLVQPILDLADFNVLNLHRVIEQLHALEEGGTPEARSHSIAYKSTQGRAVSAQSATYRQSVLGERAIDTAMKSVRSVGVGHTGNFYWQPGTITSNPLLHEVHTIIVAEKDRINFTTPNRKEDLFYVISRVRRLAR